jgi:hypothetical protein
MQFEAFLSNKAVECIAYMDENCYVIEFLSPLVWLCLIYYVEVRMFYSCTAGSFAYSGDMFLGTIFPLCFDADYCTKTHIFSWCDVWGFHTGGT